MIKPVISVVMPVFNEELHITACVNSILAQSYSNFEFIIVDDYSTDRTLDILRILERSDSRIKVYSNQGKKNNSSAANFGMSHASGSFIARMDGDDIALPYRFQKQLEFMHRHPEIGVCGTLYASYDAEMKCCILPLDDLPLGHECMKITTQIMGWGGILAHPTVMIRVGCFQPLLYDTALPFGQDSDLWLRMIESGVKFANIPEMLLKRRHHANQVTRQYKELRVREQWLRTELYLKRICGPHYTNRILETHYRVFRAPVKNFSFLLAIVEFKSHLNLLKRCNYENKIYPDEIFETLLRSKSPLRRFKITLLRKLGLRVNPYI